MEQDRILPAALSIWRTTSAMEDGKNVLKFEIRDDRSRSTVLTFEVDPGQLVLALAGQSHLSIQAMWTYMDRLGKWMESKIELIETVYKPATRENFTPAEIMEMLKPYEIMGWHGKATDLNNGLRRVRERVQSVRFFRWIDKPEEAHAPT